MITCTKKVEKMLKWWNNQNNAQNFDKIALFNSFWPTKTVWLSWFLSLQSRLSPSHPSFANFSDTLKSPVQNPVLLIIYRIVSHDESSSYLWWIRWRSQVTPDPGKLANAIPLYDFNDKFHQIKGSPSENQF